MVFHVKGLEFESVDALAVNEHDSTPRASCAAICRSPISRAVSSHVARTAPPANCCTKEALSAPGIAAKTKGQRLRHGLRRRHHR